MAVVKAARRARAQSDLFVQPPPPRRCPGCGGPLRADHDLCSRCVRLDATGLDLYGREPKDVLRGVRSSLARVLVARKLP